VISGSGELGEVIITKPAAEQTRNPLDEENVLLKIRAIKMPGKLVEVVGSVTYGVTPQGYGQSVPEQGSAPTLQDRKRYGYFFITGDAPHGTGHFEIQNGQPFWFRNQRPVSVPNSDGRRDGKD
jgi:flavodoxin